MKKKLLLIEEYYTKAWKCIKNDDIRGATLILYDRMPFALYDMSLDILYNRNIKFSNEELKHLIEKVDKSLCEYSTEEDLQEDNFAGQY